MATIVIIVVCSVIVSLFYLHYLARQSQKADWVEMGKDWADTARNVEDGLDDIIEHYDRPREKKDGNV